MQMGRSWSRTAGAIALVGALIFGQPPAIATPGANTSYSYDALGRIVRVVIDNGGTNGLTSITYSYDTAGNRTSVVSATSTNSAPTAVADAFSTAKNAAVIFDPRTNDTDAQNQYLTITAVSTPSSGTAAINSSGLLTYSPATNFTGSATFTYTISDGALTSTATDTVTITAGPAANADSFYVIKNGSYTLSPLTNDSAPSGMTLSITAVGAASHGWATKAANGTDIAYTPTGGYSGTDTFTYTVSDGHGGTATATVTANVTQPPNVVNDSVVAQTNIAKTFDPRSNDSDPQGYALTISAVGSAAHGSVTNNSGTSLTYTSVTGYTGPDSFTYTVNDGHGITATGTVNVTVNAVVAPVANTDSLTTVTNVAKTINAKANDTDPQGFTLTITAVSSPSHGSTSLAGGASITYTPTTSYTGSDSFTYTLSNGVLTSTGTVNVTVNSYSPPTAVADSMAINVSKGPTHPSVTIDPRTNDTSPSGLPLTVTAVTNGTYGTATFTGSSITYTFSAGGVATHRVDSITYTISDGINTSTASVSVDVTITVD